MMREVIDCIPSQIVLLDENAQVRDANLAFTRFARQQSEELGQWCPLGEDFLDKCLNIGDPALAARVRAGVAGVINKTLPLYKYELFVPGKARNFWFELQFSPLPEGQRGAVVSFLDVSRAKELEEHIMHDSFHDHLTGLFNRAMFLNRLDMAIKRKKRHPEFKFAVLYLDIDRFKLVNRTFGHITGDRLLMAAANRLQKCIRGVDTLARFSGDEYAMLVDDVDGEEGTAIVASRVLNEFVAPFRLKKEDVHVSVSVGVVLCDEGYEHADQILRDADNAMYSSKEAGGNRFTIFNAQMHHLTSQRLQIELDLRRALTDGELSLHYQPIVSLPGGRIIGLEALARWQHPTKGMIPPMEFIPVAEETDLIIEIGDFVLREACRKMKSIQEQYQDTQMTMSVNISGKQFEQPEFVRKVCEILDENKLEARALKLELTESVLMQDSEASIKTIASLRRLGVMVVVDDFGTGYSSLSYLERFPFHTLKVDRSFVSKLLGARQHSEIVRTIISMAHHLGLEVVAEGVENQEHLNMLSSLNCENAQGYLFSRPLDSKKLDRLLAVSLAPGQEECGLRA